MARQFLIVVALVIAESSGLFLPDREAILLVPTVAFPVRSSTNATDWLLYNQGWFYEEDPLQASIMEKSLESMIKRDIDRDRLKMFTADGEESQTVCIDGLNRSICTKTDDEGRMINTFRIRDDEFRGFSRSGPVLYQVSNARKNLRATGMSLFFLIETRYDGNLRYVGEIYPCDDRGVTFISDIDDTIKLTGVTSVTDTLINTFSGPFKAIDGMSKIYRDWQQRYNGSFAYISASPDQLYPFLRAFLDRESFPTGSAHMRHFTWFDGNFVSFFLSDSFIQHKLETLTMFFENARNRIFVLIGDIFQKDPEIYASIAAKYPNRIAHIFIRKYANDTSGQQRLEQVFLNYPRQRWATFEKGDELPQLLSLF